MVDVEAKYEKLLKEHEKLKEAYAELNDLVMPAWADEIRKHSVSERKKSKDIALEALESFDNGEDKTELGTHLLKLCKDSQLVGFCSSIPYVRVEGNDLDKLFIHPFGQRTLLYKIKKLPALLIVNSSIRYNESALAKIHENKSNAIILRDLVGITG